MSGDSLSLIRAREPAPVGAFEFWPGWVFYAPVIVQWIALGLRYGDLSLPTAANPRIELGGLCGESKSAILDQVAAEERGVLAPYAVMSVPGDPAAAMEHAGLAFPLVAKPDIGCNGTGVRLVRDQAGLDAYLSVFPRGERVVLQRFIPHVGEAGIFYVRRPGETRGRITSLTLKHAPFVIGDGRGTVRELVLADARLSQLQHMFLPKLGDAAQRVPALGEQVTLVFVGNHCKGSIFEDGAAHVSPALTERIERLARALPEFHFGRFDARFASLAALRRGEDFTIIEINGVGSEATHIWDPRARLIDAWRDQLRHFADAFAIARANRAQGARPSGLRAMGRALRRQRQLMASYPAHD